MKTTLLTVGISLFLVSICHGQSKRTIFLDPKGDTTSFELHHSFQISGKYKSVYDQKTNTKSLVPYPAGEFEKELGRTARKTVLKEKLGEEFPVFAVTDLNGRGYSKKELAGKVVVVNFWFIGCAPCEMERPELNSIYNSYKDNPHVVFISFARNQKVQLETFLVNRPFLYPVVPLTAELIGKLAIKGYPQNQIIGKDGKYFFNSIAAGIGSGVIMRRAIEQALRSY
jgi:thiol-disulfide isomerase/thioredoxin